jgi:hypothetical protein
MVKLAPLISPRPAPSPVRLRRLSEAFGDVEFAMELNNSGSMDPIAKLGFKNTPSIRIDSNPEQARAKGGRGTGEVEVGINLAKPAAFNHEFRHIGLNILIQEANKNPESFRKQYGEDFFKAFRRNTAEATVEIWDNPSDKLNSKLTPTMADTMQEVQSMKPEHRALLDKTLTRMAIDVLSDEGTPPDTVRKEPDGTQFARRTMNSTIDKKAARSWLMKILGYD